MRNGTCTGTIDAVGIDYAVLPVLGGDLQGRCVQARLAAGELRIIFRHDLRAFLAFVPAKVPPVKFAPCWTGVATSVLVPYKPPRHGKCAAYAGWFWRVSWSRY